MLFRIVYDSGTGLRDYLCVGVLLYILDVKICTDIRTERNVIYFFYALFLQPLQDMAPATLKSCLDSGCNDKRYIAALDLFHEQFNVVNIISRIVGTALYAFAALYALIVVDMDNISVITVCVGHRARSYAGVTACTFVLIDNNHW